MEKLIFIINKIKGLNIADRVIPYVRYPERCDIVNRNPSLMFQRFQYQANLFFKKIIFYGPLGRNSYYAVLVEFLVRRSPHIQSWLLNTPELLKETKDEYIAWLDGIIWTDLPDSEKNQLSFYL